MNIENIALVRVTNVLPKNGEILPVSEAQYIEKNITTDFAGYLGELLKKNIEDDLYNDCEARARYIKELKKLLPYSSNYCSTINFSLNGIVPDEINIAYSNNIFSDKDFAIIESLEEQIEKLEFITLIPTDTTIKGKMALSDKSIVLVRKERYDQLTEEEKENLSQHTNIKIFEEDLKTAIDKELLESGKYTPEELSLKSRDKGYIESDTSEETKETIRLIAEEHDIGQQLYYNTGSAQEDLQYINMVEKYYQDMFFKFIFENVDISDEMKFKLTYNKNVAKPYMKEFIQELESIGLPKYREIVEKFNKNIEELAKKGEIKTPENIVELLEKNKGKRDFNAELLENVNSIIEVDEVKKPNAEPDTLKSI